MKHVNILKHPVFYAIPVVFLIAAYFFSNSAFSRGKLVDAPALSLATKGASASTAAPEKSILQKSISPDSASPPVATTPLTASSTSPSSPVKGSAALPTAPQITLYKLANGKMLWTNVAIMPAGARFIKTL